MVSMTRYILTGALLLLLIAAPAGAIWKSKEEPEKDYLYLQAPLFNNFPAMEVVGGELTHGGSTGWMLDGTALVMTKHSRIDDDGSGRNLTEGSRALVLGYRQGEVMVVHFLTLAGTDQSMQRGTYIKRTVDRMPEAATGRIPQ